MKYLYFVSYVKETESIDDHNSKLDFMAAITKQPSYATKHKDYEFRNTFFEMQNKLESQEYVEKFERFLAQKHKCKCTLLSFTLIKTVE